MTGKRARRGLALGATFAVAGGIAATAAQPAFAAAGSLDPAFGTGGKVLTALPGGLAFPTDAVLLANGDIVTSGNFGAARLGSLPGSLPRVR